MQRQVLYGLADNRRSAQPFVAQSPDATTLSGPRRHPMAYDESLAQRIRDRIERESELVLAFQKY
jgi:hypothetical protein